MRKTIKDHGGDEIRVSAYPDVREVSVVAIDVSGFASDAGEGTAVGLILSPKQSKRLRRALKRAEAIAKEAE